MADTNPTPPKSDLEPRVAVLEQIARDTAIILAEIRADIREMRSAMRTDFRWLLAALAALLGVMAHGFHWI
jgi:tRNA threonylcarbamoyladenosine modification (KEOPS) complex  Pcc1 subunit